jgi:hypothetical protein
MATENPWTSEHRRSIGRALLDSDRALEPSEIAGQTGQNGSNVKTWADEMADEELLTKEPPTRERTGPGRKAVWAYRLARGQEDALREALAVAAGLPGGTADGHELVFAAADSLPDLFHVLMNPEYTSRAAWWALATGDQREYVVAFAPGDVDAAGHLAAVLQGADIRCRIVRVTAARPAGQLVEEARKAAQRADAERLKWQTRRAG